MVCNIRVYICNVFEHNCAHPDGDLEILGGEKWIARDQKIMVLHSAPHGVLDLVALTCLTS